MRPEGILKPLGLNPDLDGCGTRKTLGLDKSHVAGAGITVGLGLG